MAADALSSGENMVAEVLAAIYRRLPIASGLTRFAFNPVVDRIFQGAPPTLLARLRDGTPIQVDPQDYHGRILYLFGSNDIKVAFNCVTLSNLGDVFLDIGANYSTIGLAVARVVGTEGAVHLFEPQNRIADPVAEAIRTGGYRNVRLHRVGLLDVDGSFTISGPAGHSGRATFVSHEDTEGFVVIQECPVRAIDSYVGPLVAGRRFGVKIDIEGAEPKVMPWLLAQPNLSFMVFEAAHHQDALYGAVRQSGLALYGLDRSLFRFGLTRVDDPGTMRLYHDLLAVRLAPGAAAPAKAEAKILRSLMA
jgi:FkbM family methyltransferase